MQRSSGLVRTKSISLHKLRNVNYVVTVIPHGSYRSSHMHLKLALYQIKINGKIRASLIVRVWGGG